MAEAVVHTKDPKHESARTIVVSLLVCLVCSFAVSASTVVLRPIHRENQRRVQQERVREILERQPALAGLLDTSEGANVEQLVVEIATGSPQPTIDPVTFDAKKQETDEETSRAIPPDRDLAGIGRRAEHAVVTVIRRDGDIVAAVLPFLGRGYASVIRGAVAVSIANGTVLGLAIIEHDETPGLGSAIEDADWREQWAGKRIWDEEGKVRIGVDDTAAPNDVYVVEAISGATKSSMGVGNALRYWMSDDGFGLFLAKLKNGEVR